MRIENVQGVVWDLDGTLIDSMTIFEESLGEAVQNTNYSLPDHETVLRNYHGSLAETISSVLGLTPTDNVAHLVEAFMAKQARHYENNLESHLYPNATRLALHAAEMQKDQLLVTNRHHNGSGNASPRHIIASTVLATCITDIYAGDEVAYRKPDRRCLDTWRAERKIVTNELLVVGDQHVDAQLAVNLGARALIVQREGFTDAVRQLHQQYPEQVILIETLENVELSHTDARV